MRSNFSGKLPLMRHLMHLTPLSLAFESSIHHSQVVPVATPSCISGRNFCQTSQKTSKHAIPTSPCCIPAEMPGRKVPASNKAKKGRFAGLTETPKATLTERVQSRSSVAGETIRQTRRANASGQFRKEEHGSQGPFVEMDSGCDDRP